MRLKKKVVGKLTNKKKRERLKDKINISEQKEVT